MAREVIQNSWDAASDLKSQLGSAGIECPDFEIEFRFENHEGLAKQALVEALDLHGLRAHLGGAANRQKLGLAESDCLDDLSGSAPLRTLKIIERGASGMYGPFESAKSKMFLALVSLGYTVKHDGAGGSYGFGKAGLIRGSKIHSLVAYTCFPEQAEEVGIRKRLLGMTYWGQHDVGAESFTGFARLGERQELNATEWASPYENADADEVAAALGIDERDLESPDDLGSTFMLIDPAVSVEELRLAIERNWWPALVDRDFSIRLVDSDGDVSFPRPRKNKDLEPFIRGYELATTPQDNDVLEEYRAGLGRTTATSPSAEVGNLGLVAEMNGWSYADDVEALGDDDVAEHRVDHRSLVALIRGSKMVVEYADLGSVKPYVRGAFVADASVNEYLRQTEPMAHDAWRTDVGEEGVDPIAPKVAQSIHTKIRASVRTFKKKLKPPIPREEDVRLPFVQDFFRQILSGKAPSKQSPPNAEKRPISIRVNERLEIGDAHDLVRLVAKVGFALSDHHDGSAADVELKIEYRFLEDGRVGKDRCELAINAPLGFSKEDDRNSFVGELTHQMIEFDVISESYSPDWSGRLAVSGEIVGSSQTATGNDDE